MQYRSDLKCGTIVWWRFFWRYAVVFVTMNLCIGLFLNIFGYSLPRGLYTVMLLSGVFSNIVSSLLAMFYCLERKFRSSSLVLQGRSACSGFWYKLRLWLLYFWRFAIIAFTLAFVLGALLPICFQYAGASSADALKFSRYIGNIAVFPASYLAFISMICRKEKRRLLWIAVKE